MTSVGQEILKEAEALAEGTVLSAKQFLHWGTRAAVDQALSRLHNAGLLIRVKRGAYVRPVTTRFGVRAPAPERLVEHLAETTGETITPSGATAANALGLTTQVPVRQVFLTSGRNRRFIVGRQVIELRHAPSWQLRDPGKLSGEALRALGWMGRGQATTAAAKLAKVLPEAERQAMLRARGGLPTWLAETVSHAFAPRQRAGE